ncbi:putative ubiquitinyl hydrolase 1 [Rosa chinensis]|uniref:Putative ubiquitinyl hydrolase 1 n=1 Tax=Rosa chinensis TaxID=74649 RepID=A0A2P6PFN9_ROSCH|nr:putative ubiquitinyl hydrolase 1 [Rosa chinensis]
MLLILLRPRQCDENLVEQLSMHLAVADASGLPAGWSRLAHFSFTLVNQLDGKKSITKSTKGTVLFNEYQSELGFKPFVPASELYDWTAGYLVSNKCIIKAKVASPIVKIEDPGTENTSKKESNRKEPSNVNSGQAQVFSAFPKTQVAALHDTPTSEPFCTKVTTPTDIVEDLGTGTSSEKKSNREEPSNVNSAQVFSAAPKTISSEQVADLQDTTASEPFCIKATNDGKAGPSVVEKLGGVFTSHHPIAYRIQGFRAHR